MIRRIADAGLGCLEVMLDSAVSLRSDLVWRRYDHAYRGQPSDIFVVSFPRSGTTLVQMLLYQLATNGEMDLPHIGRFSPYLEGDLLKEFLTRRVTIDTLPPPHVIKSHLPYKRIPKGSGKYIYVMRCGLDVVVSNYFHRVRQGYRHSFADFFQPFVVPSRERVSWFEHVRDWLQNKRRLNVIYVTYEELTADLPRIGSDIARFCGVDVPPSDWPRILNNCSFEQMRRHEAKLDTATERRMEPEELHFVRRGRVGGWRPIVAPEMVRVFHKTFDARLGDLPAAATLRGTDDTQ